MDDGRAQDHYFETPTGPGRRRDVTVAAWGAELTLYSADGVFSHARLDKATAILLDAVDPPTTGTVLDLGCGWGPIACAIAHRSPSTTVWATDVNERALELTRDNAARLGVEVGVAAPDDVPADLTFDHLWSNPPIRVGKPALHALLQRWLPRLADGGTAHLVVGKNLGADSLHRWLADQGWSCERTASAKGFRVLTVTRG